MDPSPILTPADDRLDTLCQSLADASAARDAATRDAFAARDTATRDAATSFPLRQLAWCGAQGVFRWSASCERGGLGWSDADQLRGYLRLGEACLTTAFVITQRTAASTRLAESANHALREQLLPDLLSGRTFATVAISQLTTSRRHLAAPVLRARETADGYVFQGYSPWVTGAKFADWIAVGAVLEDGRHVLAAVPANSAGVSIDPPHELAALEASHTGPVRFDDVVVERAWMIAGPSEQVLRTARSGGSGGLQTSALALALASRSIRFLEAEAAARSELRAAAESFRSEWHVACQRLLEAAGEAGPAGRASTDFEALRASANELALRASQAALVAAKGAGFVAGHPAGRWCREALFFLVWSCPPGVLATHLREWTDGCS